MHSEKEIRDDMDKFRAFVDALRDKYGDDFSCILSAGVSMEKYWAGCCLSCGNDYLLHQACHGLLDNARFIDEFFNAVKCVLDKLGEDKPEFMKLMMRESMNSLKRLLITDTEGFKQHLAEEDANNAVKDLLKQAGFEN